MMGERRQAGCIYDPAEADGLRKAKYRVIEAFHGDEQALGVVFGDLTFHEAVHPQEGPIVVGEAEVVRLVPAATRILHQLTRGELAALRAATRRAQQRARPGAAPLSDRDCDLVIEQQAPRTLERRIAKLAVNAGER